jgi:MoxR-like ATPase
MEHSNRQLYINNITEQLNKLERSQKKDKEAVSFLEKSADYQTKKAQVKEDIKNREQDILKLQEQLQNISSGSLDIEINDTTDFTISDLFKVLLLTAFFNNFSYIFRTS